MKAFVDKDKCIGCGMCEGICPKVFKMNEDNIAEAVEHELEGEDLQGANEAQDQCPAGAIEVKK